MKLSVIFRPQNPLKVKMDAARVDVSLGNSIVKEYVDAPVYTGEYVVTPLAHEQTVLETSGKRMADDVTVRKVPYYEVSNLTGKTVYIANTIND